MTKPFIWQTQEGAQLAPGEMRTAHLFYSLRMIFNHTAPPAYRIHGCRSYTGPESWSIAYRRAAVRALVAELKTRRDLQPFMLIQLRHIVQVAAEVLELEA